MGSPQIYLLYIFWSIYAIYYCCINQEVVNLPLYK